MYFLLPSSIPLYECTTICLAVVLNEHFVGSQLWENINKAAMNISSYKHCGFWVCTEMCYSAFL